MKMIRKAALRIGAPALLAFLACNTFLAINHLKEMQKIAALTLESSMIQADISGVLKDLTDMETGQRGYLLTGDPLYLQPYSEAKDRISRDFARLRAGLAKRSDRQQSAELQVESLANSKQAEMEHSIGLRQQGYRRRAFKLVDSNEGMEYMVKARELLSSLAAVETNNFARLDSEKNASLSKALRQTIGANGCLLLLAACLLALGRYHGQVLEQEAAQSRHELAARDLQLEKLTSALSNQARSKTSAIEVNARLLLQNYGGFLPRQGHQYAEQIKEASAQMEQLRQDLVGSPDSSNNEKEAYESVA
jgi:CHASE3 domain sensor protein